MTAEKHSAPEGDPLLDALHDLPVHPPTGAPGRRVHHEASAAFVRAFDDTPWYRAEGGAGRAAMPVVLASVVGLYLFWAFAAAISLNR